MCTDGHYDNEDEAVEHYALLSDRIMYLEIIAEYSEYPYYLKDSINSLNEAMNRNCFEHDPWFPMED